MSIHQPIDLQGNLCRLLNNTADMFCIGQPGAVSDFLVGVD